MSAKAKIFNPLENKKVFVKYKMNFKNGITAKDHPLYGGKLDGVIDTFYVKKSASGGYIDPFTKDEREFVADKLSIDIKRLSPHSIVDNYWKTYTVGVGKEGAILDMSRVEDFIKLKVLLTNNGIVAPNPSVIEDKASYRYFIIDEGDEVKMKNKSLDSKKEAYMNYGKVEGDKLKLAYLIWSVDQKMISANTSIEDVKALLEPLIETKTKQFNGACTDKYFQYKVLIYKGMLSGVIERRNNEYFMEDTHITTNGGSASFESTAIFLADPANQTVKFLIEDRIKTAKE